jgi:hypothetical protein
MKAKPQDRDIRNIGHQDSSGRRQAKVSGQTTGRRIPLRPQDAIGKGSNDIKFCPRHGLN